MSEPIKIFNFACKSPKKIETEDFVIEQSPAFGEAEEKFYRSTPRETTTVTFNEKSPVTLKKTTREPQEGMFVWTHTLTFKEGTDIKSKLGFLEEANISEDVCLLLSFFTGKGVYTKETSFYYSHKAEIHARTKLQSSELQEGIKCAWRKITNSTKEERDILGLILSKYREAMQPMSYTNQLVRLWEIIDILADFYCENPKKEIPEGYDENSLKTTLEGELDALELKIKIPLRDGFTPIQKYKSIRQKIRELINSLKIHELLDVELDELRRKTMKSYEFRSKLTHSSKVDFKDDKSYELVNFSFFVSSLVFVVLLRILNFTPCQSQTLGEIKMDIKEFIKDEKYYTNSSDEIENNIQRLDEIADFLNGKKP